MGRTVVIGLDGADWDLLEGFIEEGVTPNIAEVYNQGFHGDLRSIDPPVSVPAWMSFFTGKRPDKLDVYNFLGPEERTNRINRDQKVGLHNFDAFWNRLENVGVIGVPSSIPTDSLNGFLVSGPFTPDRCTEDIRDLKESHGYERHLPNMWQFNESINKLKNEKKFLNDVLDRKSPQFFMAATSVTDRLQHSFWNDEDRMRELYREADSFVGTILSHFNEEDNVFIVSDHGFEKLEKNFYINSWLREKGFLSLESGEENSVSKEDLRYRLKKTSKNFLSRLGVLETAIKVFPSSIRKSVQHSDDIWTKVNYEETKAFAAGNYVGEIYINRKEYENGCVSEEDFEEVREDLINRLKQVEDPETGEKVVDQIWKGDEIFRDFADRAPDILFYTKEMKYKVKHDLHGKAFEDAIPVGAHGLNGIIIGRGPDIKEGNLDMHLTDVAPTILHLLGEEIPEDMDGCVKKEIFLKNSEPKQRKVSGISTELNDLDF